MSYRTLAVALLLTFVYCSVSDAQLFRRLREARQNRADTAQRELEKQQKAEERELEKREKAQEKLQKERARLARKNQRNNEKAQAKTPSQAENRSPNFNRPRAASSLASNSQASDQNPDKATPNVQLYFLDEQRRAQQFTGTRFDPNRQYYRRDSSFSRNGQNFFVLQPVSAEYVQSLLKQRAQPASRVPTQVASDILKKPVANTSFDEPLFNAPLDASAKPNEATVSGKSTPIPAAVSPAAPKSKPKSEGVLRSVLERIDDPKDKTKSSGGNSASN